MRSANMQSFFNNGVLSGYEKIRKYPTFDYSDDFYKQVKHDTRDVLFWNPFSVSESGQQKVSIQFYNNDSAKEFRIIILGFTPDGEPVYYNSTIK